MDNPGAIFGILVLLVGLLATAGYGLMSVAQYRAARVAFGLTALFLAAIGIELGLVMTWPLAGKIIVAGCFGFAAAGALVYAFHSVSLLDSSTTKSAVGLFIECNPISVPYKIPPEGRMWTLGLWSVPDKNFGGGLAQITSPPGIDYPLYGRKITSGHPMSGYQL